MCIRIGGVDVKDMISSVMNKLMTDEVMMNFNMKAQRGTKFGFERTSLCKVITGKRIFFFFSLSHIVKFKIQDQCETISCIKM